MRILQTFWCFLQARGLGPNLNYKPGAAKQRIFTVNVVQLLQYDGVLLWIKINRFVIWKISWSTAPLYCLKIASRKAQCCMLVKHDADSGEQRTNCVHIHTCISSEEIRYLEDAVFYNKKKQNYRVLHQLLNLKSWLVSRSAGKNSCMVRLHFSDGVGLTQSRFSSFNALNFSSNDGEKG